MYMYIIDICVQLTTTQNIYKHTMYPATSIEKCKQCKMYGNHKYCDIAILAQGGSHKFYSSPGGLTDILLTIFTFMYM